MRFARTRQAGISLFETTIVVFIIGFLVAAVLVGNAVIERATARKLGAEMRDVKYMMNLYKDRYDAIPGDDLIASKHVTGAMDSAMLGGDAAIYSLFGWTSTETSIASNRMDESAMFWQHLRLSGIAPGNAKDPLAHNAVGGDLGITSSGGTPIRPPGIAGLYTVCSSRINGSLARQMDTDMDDGDATSGNVWAAAEAGKAVTTFVAPTAYVNEKTYTVCTAF